MSVVDSLSAIETLVAVIKKQAEEEAHEVEEDDEDERLLKDKPTPEENTKLYGKSEVLADDSNVSNTVDRSDKEDRKKLAVIKLMRMK